MQTIYGSHAAIPPFRLLRPERVEEASAAHADLGAEALFLLGPKQLEPQPMYEALRELLAVAGEE